MSSSLTFPRIILTRTYTERENDHELSHYDFLCEFPLECRHELPFKHILLIRAVTVTLWWTVSPRENGNRFPRNFLIKLIKLSVFNLWNQRSPWSSSLRNVHKLVRYMSKFLNVPRVSNFARLITKTNSLVYIKTFMKTPPYHRRRAAPATYP